MGNTFSDIRPDSAVLYHAYIPAKPRHPLLVMVHGVNTRPERMVQYGARLAGRYGVPLLVPDFSSIEFKGYQRLRGRKSEHGAATGLLAAVQDITRRHNLPSSAFNLMGFSAGAQFAHRFALCYPQHVRSLVVAAPGWFTYLDPALDYPLGLGNGEVAPSSLRTAQFLNLPIMVAVGDADDQRDRRLRTSADLDRHQGRNRLERAERWFRHIRNEAVNRAITPHYSFVPLAGTGHSLSQAVKSGGLMDHLFRFILEPAVHPASDTRPAPLSSELSAAVCAARSRLHAEHHS